MAAHLQRVTIAPHQYQDQTLRLTPAQQHYLYRVLRLQEGDRFIAMNGQGQAWIAQLATNTAILQNGLEVTSELPIPLTLLVALPKGNGFEEIIRCGTELGVSAFVPVESDRTLLKPSPQKLKRWRRIAQEAAEQAERAIVPPLQDPLPFSEAVQALNPEQQTGYICIARGEYPPLFNRLSPPPIQPISLFTGPEGGWTPKEIEAALEAGIQPVSLGKTILRAITAPIVATALMTQLITVNSKP
ncbi:16S rRNA (uracil(1498)-N(3))-methyltransferase [Spirulina sp. CS-785/01]|uniref:16S rRNA (uracil(1498)-N(3))-methyltransferase n=1 Tax=Spirulina sp. CS-785/01 TaxID=3021716 RepID=UPI00232C56A3|nr:16S rRNA (uracil(1498)-N(3))-methyltransferase [Spirulina sp. CS-785/01]MDB9312775.1 16S rRNA (uracil(1498)-N(3))-methyltransferase [Spirulina sp. CS-785/01]